MGAITEMKIATVRPMNTGAMRPEERREFRGSVTANTTNAQDQRAQKLRQEDADFGHRNRLYGIRSELSGPRIGGLPGFG